MTLIFEGCPEPVTLTHFQDSPTNFVLQWSICEDTISYKFVKYSLYGSNDNHKLNRDYFDANKKLLYETQTRLDTIYTLHSGIAPYSLVELYKKFESNEITEAEFLEGERALEPSEYFKHFQIIVWGLADDRNHHGGHCGVITHLLNVSYNCD